MIFSVRTFPRSRVRGDSVAEYEKAAVLDREPPQIRKPERVLLADSRHARELDAFHVFEQRAAARRDVADVAGQAELVDGRHRVAAADQREGALLRGFDDRLGQRAQPWRNCPSRIRLPGRSTEWFSIRRSLSRTLRSLSGRCRDLPSRRECRSTGRSSSRCRS